MLSKILILSEILDSNLQSVDILTKFLLISNLALMEFFLLNQKIFLYLATKLKEAFWASKKFPPSIEIFIGKFVSVTLKTVEDLKSFVNLFLYSD